MSVTLLHTGQTGVERGAARAARTLGMKVSGFCPYERRDEFGALPPEVVANLARCSQRGARSALRATLDDASVLVIGVATVKLANENPGVESLRRLARARGVPHWILDPLSDLDEFSRRIRDLERSFDPLRLMVTGPRFTRWHDGEKLGFRVISQLALSALLPQQHRVLIVGEETHSADAICALLRQLGHDVATASDVSSGLDMLHRFAPDIGVFDIDAASGSGYELARRVRELATRHVFLAAVSSHDHAQELERARRGGFDELILRPVGPELVASLIEAAERPPLVVG